MDTFKRYKVQGAAEFQFAVDPSETKEAFMLEPFGPLQTNRGSFPQTLWLVWGGVKEKFNSDVEQSNKL